MLRSKAKSEDDGLTTPSWDASGDLWVADRDPEELAGCCCSRRARASLMVVTTPGLEGRIKAVRVAADGVRIALIVRKDGRTTLLIGRVERQDGSDGKPSVSVQELRSVAPQLEEVTAMSWAGDSRLVVVGREAGGVQQIQYVQVDGSTPVGPAPAALTGVKEIAASEDERLPLVAHSEDGIVRLSSGSAVADGGQDGDGAGLSGVSGGRGPGVPPRSGRGRFRLGGASVRGRAPSCG